MIHFQIKSDLNYSVLKIGELVLSLLDLIVQKWFPLSFQKESHHDTTEVLTSKYFKGDEKPEDTSGPRAEMQRSKVCESGNLEPQSQSSQLEKSDQEERDSQKSLTGLSNPPRKEVGSSQPSQGKLLPSYGLVRSRQYIY